MQFLNVAPLKGLYRKFQLMLYNRTGISVIDLCNSSKINCSVRFFIFRIMIHDVKFFKGVKTVLQIQALMQF